MPVTQQRIPGHVHRGRDGYLFLVDGNNHVLSQYEDTDVMRALLACWRHIIAARERRLRAAGVAYRHICVPEKLSIYDHMTDGLPFDAALSPARRLYRQDPFHLDDRPRGVDILRALRRRARWRRTVIDLVGPMRRARDRRPLYFRTDTHWTLAGREIAYRRICRALGARARRDFAQRESVILPDFAGDLGAACDPPIRERVPWHLVGRDAVRVYASPIVAHRERTGRAGTLHYGAHVVYRNDASGDPRRVVLFGDSYANFAPILLTIMLAETFREVHFIWSTSIDWAYVARVAPDIVLTEMAERFMLRLPDDDDFDVEGYARERFGAELSAATA